jgi:predicted RNase H-like HicB family nuclease
VVAEDLLDRDEIDASLDQVRGVTVAQAVRRDVFFSPHAATTLRRVVCTPPPMPSVGPLNCQIDCRGTIAYGGVDMNQHFTAVVKQDGPWWIGWVEEVPGVNCQERTRDELLKTLRVTLMEALEMNRTDARDAAGKGYEELSIAV